MAIGSFIKSKQPKLFKKFPTTKKKLLKASGEEYSDDEEEDIIYYPRKRRSHPSRWFFNPNEDILMPSDVTDDMLENIIDDFVSNKVYDQGPKGSTCHQKAKKTFPIYRSVQVENGLKYRNSWDFERS